MSSTGIMLALLSALLFGASTPIAKLLLGAIDPWLLAGLLYLGSGIGLGIVTAIPRLRGAAPREAKLARSDLPWLAGAVLSGGVLGPLMLMFGLARPRHQPPHFCSISRPSRPWRSPGSSFGRTSIAAF